MIKYNFGLNCKIDWEKFLSLKTFDNNKTLYKSDFESFADLYEYIDKHKIEIKELLFNGYQYFLEDGLLHNLYGPAKITISDKNKPFYKPGHTLLSFYINGKEVKYSNKHCSKLKDFNEEKIYFHHEITNKKTERINGVSYRRKEGIDYTKEYINLELLRKLDLRKRKLNRILK